VTARAPMPDDASIRGAVPASDGSRPAHASGADSAPRREVTSGPSTVTRLIELAQGGDAAACADLIDAVYGELRQMAQTQMAAERQGGRGHTLQPTALVHEVFVRLLGSGPRQFDSRRHFFGAAAQAMRRILIDYARARSAIKRGGGRGALTLTSAIEAVQQGASEEMLSLDEAIQRLEEVDGSAALVVRLRFFGGLSEEAAAEVMEVSARTVRRQWAFARAWLRDWLESQERPGAGQ
jgi:RNA polymerase sigma factor (TIGR02999 family)